MKYLISIFLLSGIAFAEEVITQEEIEVGSPRDCVVVGTKNDTAVSNELNQIQQQITDCLAPQEEQVTENQSGTKQEIVSQ